VDAHKIQNLIDAGLSSGNSSIPNGWAPVVDNVTYFANSTERMEKGLVSTVARTHHELRRLQRDRN
jgi:hypothetical protein